jgi:hypothetical protein
MATYTATGAANLLMGAEAPLLSQRVTMSLLKYAASIYAAAKAEGGASYNYIRQLAANPYGQANAVIPVLVAVMTVASPGTDQAPSAPTDAELTTAITNMWSFFSGSA